MTEETLVTPKTCRRCGNLFMPSLPGEKICGRCSPDPQPFPPQPIDLWEQWS